MYIFKTPEDPEAYPIYTIKEGFHALVKAPGNSSLSDEGFKWACYNFNKLISHLEFYELSLIDLMDLFNLDDINVRSEDTIFNAYDRWLNHNKRDFLQHGMNIIEVIRMMKITPKYLVDKVSWNFKYVESDEDYASRRKPNSNYLDHIELKSNELDEFFISVISAHMFPNRTETKEFLSLRPHLMLSRRPRPRLLAVGSWYESTCDVVEYYDLEAASWTKLKSMGIKRIYYGCGLVRNELMIVGGQQDKKAVKTMQSYNFVSGELTDEEPMNEERSFLGLAINDYDYPIKVLAVGGINDGKILDTVEQWDEESKKWIRLPRMNIPRMGCGVAVLNNKLYVCGGKTDEGCTSNCEYYDFVTKKWIKMADMTTKRSYFKMEILDGRIYAVGGYKIDYGTVGLCSVEKYDPIMDKWTLCTMTTFTGTMGVGVMCDRIICAGGGIPKSLSRGYVEELNMVTDIWEARPPLNEARDGITIVNLPMYMLNDKLCE